MRFRYWFKIHWKSLTFDRPSVGGLLLSISPFSIVSSLEEIWIKFKSVHRAMSVLIIVINKKLTLWILFSSLRRSQFCPFFVLLLLLLLWTPKSSSLASLNISIKLQLWGRIFSPSLSLSLSLLYNLTMVFLALAGSFVGRSTVGIPNFMIETNIIFAQMNQGNLENIKKTVSFLLDSSFLNFDRCTVQYFLFSEEKTFSVTRILT